MGYIYLERIFAKDQLEDLSEEQYQVGNFLNSLHGFYGTDDKRLRGYLPFTRFQIKGYNCDEVIQYLNGDSSVAKFDIQDSDSFGLEKELMKKEKIKEEIESDLKKKQLYDEKKSEVDYNKQTGLFIVSRKNPQGVVNLNDISNLSRFEYDFERNSIPEEDLVNIETQSLSNGNERYS